ncbi:hypothetical protein MPNTM1_02524 [Mycolicibacterium parafortuitum]|uniref:hypothetical protein n=1 Tax=Mycolicibacterium parafortuitum TaxID=39692 RepID=UPI0032C3EB68
MTSQLSELVLRHIDVSKLCFQQRHPGIEFTDPPSWFVGASAGGLGFAAWLRGSVLVQMEMKVEKPAYYAVVAMLALFSSDEQNRAQDAELSSEVDDSTLSAASSGELAEFARRAAREMYPFLRSEMYSLTSKIYGVNGFMLQPRPFLDDDTEIHVGGPRDAIRIEADRLGFSVVYNISTQTDTLERGDRAVKVTYSKSLDQVLDVQTESHQFESSVSGAFQAMHAVATSQNAP